MGDTYTYPDDDPHKADLQLLTRDKASSDVLQNCPGLLKLVDGRLTEAGADTVLKARAVEVLLKEVVDRSFETRQAEPANVEAGLVLAAGAAIGLVPVEPSDIDRPPSQMIIEAPKNKGDRQSIAVQYVPDIPPTKDRRRFWDHEARSLNALRNSMMNLLADDEAVETLRGRLKILPPPDTVPDPLPPIKNSKIRVKTLALVGVAAIAAAGITLGVVLSHKSGTPSPDPAQPGGSRSTTTGGPSTNGDSSSDQVKLVFDALGGRPPIIQVYPGVSDSASDRVGNGTFNSGDKIAALCKTKGRMVKSQPELGDQARSSEDWIRIEGSPGVTQYATAVYVKDPDVLLGKLSNCSSSGQN